MLRDSQTGIRRTKTHVSHNAHRSVTQSQPISLAKVSISIPEVFTCRMNGRFVRIIYSGRKGGQGMNARNNSLFSWHRADSKRGLLCLFYFVFVFFLTYLGTPMPEKKYASRDLSGASAQTAVEAWRSVPALSHSPGLEPGTVCLHFDRLFVFRPRQFKQQVRQLGHSNDSGKLTGEKTPANNTVTSAKSSRILRQSSPTAPASPSC